MILVCGSSEPLTYGAAAGRLDRFARLEAGILGGNPCLLGVSSFDNSAAYRLNLHHGANQTASLQFLSPVTPSGNGILDARLIEHADRALAELKRQRR